MKYGYLRTDLSDSETSADTSEDPEVTKIKEKQVSEKNIYIDIEDRNDQYDKLMKRLKAGDMLYLGSLTYLGKDYEGIIEQWNFITENKKADIAVLDMPLLNTSLEGTRLDRNYIAELTQQILSFADQHDKALIYDRRSERHRIQAEGIAIARKKGVKFGRHEEPLPNDFAKIVELQTNKELTAEQAADKLGMPLSTYYYKARKYRMGQG